MTDTELRRVNAEAMGYTLELDGEDHGWTGCVWTDKDTLVLYQPDLDFEQNAALDKVLLDEEHDRSFLVWSACVIFYNAQGRYYEKSGNMLDSSVLMRARCEAVAAIGGKT